MFCGDERMKVTVVIPTYKEEENINNLINALNLVLTDHEILVVDDNSPDKTREMASALPNVRVLHRVSNRGLFNSINEGVNNASGEYIVIMDADFSHPPEVIPSLLKFVPEFDLVNGSRYVPGGDVLAPLHRTKYVSMYLNKWSGLVLGIKQKDITGGFHVIKRSKWSELNFKFHHKWGEFDIELFYRAKQMNWKVLEVPYIQPYRKRGDSKSTPIKYLCMYILFTLKLWWYK